MPFIIFCIIIYFLFIKDDKKQDGSNGGGNSSNINIKEINKNLFEDNYKNHKTRTPVKKFNNQKSNKSNNQTVKEKDKYFSGGIGTKKDPFMIKNAKQLNNIRYYLDKHFKLVDNIDLGKNDWTPIGKSYKEPFVGTFDGDNHKISGLLINKPNNNNLGLFGYVGTHEGDTIIKNISLEQVEIIGDNWIGSLVGTNRGKVINCCAKGGTILGKGHVGGLIGTNYGESLNSFFEGKVEGGGSIGGLIGENGQGASIINSYTQIDVIGENYVGGLVGTNSIAGNIKGSYVLGEIKGKGAVGGFVGINFGSINASFVKCQVTGSSSVGGFVGANEKVILNCFSTGRVTGSVNVGGLVGWDSGDLLKTYDDSIFNCYSVVEVFGKKSVGGLVGQTENNIKSSYYIKSLRYDNSVRKGLPVSELEMKQKNTFKNWDFNNIWTINDGNSFPCISDKYVIN